MKWEDKESKLFTAMCGESFTWGEVIATGAVTFGLLVIAMIAGL